MSWIRKFLRKYNSSVVPDHPHESFQQVVEWSRTPFDEDGEFDLFMSYKSEDVHFVRRVADLLIANGLAVWFVEYINLLDFRGDFQSQLNEKLIEGIQRSRFGVVFTNNRYSCSKFCQFELKRLNAKHDPPRVIQVLIPDEPLHSECPDVEAIHVVPEGGGFHRSSDELLSSDVVDVANSIYSKLSRAQTFDAETLIKPNGPPTEYRDPDFNFVVDTTNWELIEGAGGTRFEGKLGNNTVSWNVASYCLRDDERMPKARRSDDDQILDDRDCFEEIIRYAQTYFGQLAVSTKFEDGDGFRTELDIPLEPEPRGVHLFFKDGYSHVLLTYWLVSKWMRRYVLVYPVPASDKTVEVNFTFAFLGPFVDFCRYSYAMDSVVDSLKFEPDIRQTASFEKQN